MRAAHPRAILAAACLVLWVLGGTATPAAAQSPAPVTTGTDDAVLLDELRACRARLDPALDVGFDRIAARCPGLAPALRASDVAAWLPRDWSQAGNDLSAGSLAALERLLAARGLERGAVAAPASAAPRGARPSPDVGTLNEVLADLGAQGVERGGLWSRMTRWLRAMLERQPDEATGSGWLDRLLRDFDLSRDTWTLISYLILAAIVVLAALVVGSELRQGGWLRRARSSAGAADALGFDASGSARLADLDHLPPAERPALLLRLLVQLLVERHRLSAGVSMTGRELLRRRGLLEETDRADATSLVRAAEGIRYGAEPPPVATIDAAVRAGRALLERLARAPA